MKTLSTNFAAALVAASAFGASAAFASGEYYVGGAPSAQSQNIDTVRTHSTGERVAVRDTTVEYKNNDRGDYRPMVPAANAN